MIVTIIELNARLVYKNEQCIFPNVFWCTDQTTLNCKQWYSADYRLTISEVNVQKTRKYSTPNDENQTFNQFELSTAIHQFSGAHVFDPFP